MIEIIPAILPARFADIEAHLERIQSLGGLVQVDLVGKNTIQGEEVMPMWEEFDFEFDVMLPNPAAELASCVAIGASRICIHADAHSAHEAVSNVQHLRGGNYATEVGVALRVDDTVHTFEPYIELVDYVQVMGIARVGLQGEPFDERCIALVKQLREKYPNLIIQVDGGVDRSNVRALAAAGANRLVCGHAIFNEADPLAALEALKAEANN